jgi:hypothetical protein
MGFLSLQGLYVAGKINRKQFDKDGLTLFQVNEQDFDRMDVSLML